MSDNMKIKPVLWTLVFNENYGANAETTFKTEEKAQKYASMCVDPKPAILPLYTEAAAKEAKIGALVAAITKARDELAALIEFPERPELEHWPVERRGDAECLQIAYRTLQLALLRIRLETALQAATGERE